MNKKELSPLIGLVLIIGFTITLAVIIIFFGEEEAKEQKKIYTSKDWDCDIKENLVIKEGGELPNNSTMGTIPSKYHKVSYSNFTKISKRIKTPITCQLEIRSMPSVISIIKNERCIINDINITETGAFSRVGVTCCVDYYLRELRESLVICSDLEGDYIIEYEGFCECPE